MATRDTTRRGGSEDSRKARGPSEAARRVLKDVKQFFPYLTQEQAEGAAVEILDLVYFVVERGMDISFIEEMPLGLIDEHDRALAFYSSDQVRSDIEARYRLIPTTETTGGPSRYFQVGDTDSRVGFISPHSHNFCESCNRVRVTVQGRLLLCLGQEHSVDLRQVLRSHPGDGARLEQAIVDAMAIKPKGHDFDLSRQVVILRHMSVTGG